ncbi:MAG: alpha/beta fold hydrolase [Gemmatimonadota bacterium]
MHEENRSLETALAAERSALEYYGLNVIEHRVPVSRYDLELRVLEVGEGEPLAFVPGGSGDVLQMFPLMAGLRGYRMLAVSRPGAAGSTPIDYREVDVRRLAVAVISAVLDHFELRQSTLVAHSMGGLWAFWMALDEPDRISTIVQGGCPALLLGTSAPFPMRLISTPVLGALLFPAARPDGPKDVTEGLKKMMGSPDESIEALPPEMVEARYELANLPTYRLAWHTMMQATLTLRGANPRYRLRESELERIGRRVLFIWGRHDPFGSVDVGRRAVELMPDARLDLVDAGHVVFLDRPEESAELIRRFLSGGPTTSQLTPDAGDRR